MDGSVVSRRRKHTAEAEAAAWQVRLESAPSAALRSAHRAWLEDDPRHEAAFELAEEVRAMLPRAAEMSRTEDLAASAGAEPASTRRRGIAALAACLAFVLAVSAALFMRPGSPEILETAVGEQAVRQLEDGSTASLDTLTRLEVDFSERKRAVTLEEGEAVFDVAHDPVRPFVVQAGDLQVVAVGTRFVVRRVGTDVSVTLIEGQVQVSRKDPTGQFAPVEVVRSGASLQAGERLRLTTDGAARRDMRAPEDVAAWRRGRLVFEDIPLAEAIGELNRYGGTRLAVGRDISSITISGSFATDQPVQFAQAIAQLYGFELRNVGQTIVIELPGE